MSRDLFYSGGFVGSKKELILERISTGIPKLDELLQGGIPKNSVTLVSGPPGSGKTMLCYHFINAGIKNGERCLYLSVDQNVKPLLMHAYSAGFDFLPAIEKGLLKVFHVDVEKANAYTEIEEEAMAGSFSRIVMDSLSPFADTPLVFSSDVDFEKAPILDKLSSYPSDSRPVIRSHVRRIFEFLHEIPSTSMLTSELLDHGAGLSRDTVSEFLADGVILLTVDPMMDRRKLTIWKMRGTKHTLKPQDVFITDGGLMLK